MNVSTMTDDSVAKKVCHFHEVMTEFFIMDSFKCLCKEVSSFQGSTVQNHP